MDSIQTRLSWLFSPPGATSIVLGLCSGLFMGALELVRSPETATGVVLAWFIGIAIGFWIGTNSVRIMVRTLELVIKDTDRLCNEFVERFEKLTGEEVGEIEVPRTFHKRLWLSLTLTIFATFPIFGVVLSSFGAVMVILIASGLSPSLSFVVVSSAIAIGFILTSTLAFGSVVQLDLRARNLAHKLDEMDSHSKDFNSFNSGQYLHSAFQKTNKVVGFLTKHSAPV